MSDEFEWRPESAEAVGESAPAAESAPSLQGEGEPPPATGADQGDGEVLFLTLLDSELPGAEGLPGAPPATELANIEHRLAVREALLPSLAKARAAKPRAPRCRACGGQPARGTGGYCAECTEAAGGGGGGDGEEAAPPPCADCGRQFDSSASLVSHRTHEHTGTAQSCPFCSKVFQRRTDLKTHMNLHLGIKKSVCDVCGRQFSHMSNLYRHRRIHTGERPYVCSICGKRFSQANALNAHTETHEVKSLHKCPFCPKKFRNRPRLACHIRLMHQPTAEPARRRFVARQFHCGVCGERLASLARLRRHQASHPAASLRCAVCRETFSSAAELTRHGCSLPGRAEDEDEDEEEEPAELSDAEELAPPAAAATGVMSRPRLLRPSFMLSDSRERKEEEPAALLAAAEQDTEVGRLMDEMVAVQSVGTQYDVNEILYLTETERLGSPPPPPPSPPPPPPPVPPLPSLPSLSPLPPPKLEGSPEDHVDQVIEDVAHGELGPVEDEHRIPCATCGRLFTRVQNLRQHEAMHDASLQRFVCPHCGKSFAWQQTRDRHVAQKHTDGVRHVECPDCLRMFLPDSLRGHRRRVHQKLKGYTCHLCPKSFHTRTELHSHLRSHTHERPYVCCTCGRQFAHLTHLRRHEEVHRQAEEQEEKEEAARPGVRRTYQSRLLPTKIAPRPPPPPGQHDIVKHSLQSARIPVRFVTAAPVMAQMAPMATMTQMAPMATVAGMSDLPDGQQQIVMSGGAPDGEVTVVGPECTEIIIVECEV